MDTAINTYETKTKGVTRKKPKKRHGDHQQKADRAPRKKQREGAAARHLPPAIALTGEGRTRYRIPRARKTLRHTKNEGTHTIYIIREHTPSVDQKIHIFHVS